MLTILNTGKKGESGYRGANERYLPYIQPEFIVCKHEPAAVLGTEDATRNTVNKVLDLISFHSNGRMLTININKYNMSGRDEY